VKKSSAGLPSEDK